MQVKSSQIKLNQVQFYAWVCLFLKYALGMWVGGLMVGLNQTKASCSYSKHYYT